MTAPQRQLLETKQSQGWPGMADAASRTRCLQVQCNAALATFSVQPDATQRMLAARRYLGRRAAYLHTVARLLRKKTLVLARLEALLQLHPLCRLHTQESLAQLYLEAQCQRCCAQVSGQARSLPAHGGQAAAQEEGWLQAAGLEPLAGRR